VLRSVAEYDVEDELQQRLRELGENKEACFPEDRQEHRQLAEFWRKQTLRNGRKLPRSLADRQRLLMHAYTDAFNALV